MLEPMCGYAEGIEIAEQHFGLDCDYHAFDYSDVIVNEISRRLPEGRVWEADVTTYRPEPHTYDLVLLVGGLHHVPDSTPHVVRNLTAGLKTGGFFINFEPTSGNLLFRLIHDWIYQSSEIFDDENERSSRVLELKNFSFSS